MTFEELNFVTFCVNNLVKHLGWSASKVYDTLCEYGILEGYILRSYDVLHTFSKEYITEDLVLLLKEKGALT